MDEADRAAFAASHLRALPAATVVRLTERPAGAMLRPVTPCTAPVTTSAMSNW